MIGWQRTVLTMAAVASLGGGAIGAAPAASASPGPLDLAFGSAGVARLDLKYHDFIPAASAVQPDGKIVVVGTDQYWFQAAIAGPRLFVARFLPNGAIDGGFGSGGLVETTVTGGYGAGSSEASAGSVAIDSQGRIVVGGSANENGIGIQGVQGEVMLLARYLPNGLPDTTFGNQGLVLTQLNTPGYQDVLTSLALQSDDRVVVSGFTTDILGRGSPVPVYAVVLRYDINGTLDPTFQTVKYSILGGADAPNQMAVMADGRIVTALGRRFFSYPDPNWIYLNRYLPNGVPDPTFGTAGFAKVSLVGHGADGISGLVVDSRGSLTIAGRTGDYPSQVFLTRLRPNGALDTRFAGGVGASFISVSGQSLASLGLGRDRAGRWLAPVQLRQTPGSGAGTYGAARFVSAGSADPTYGSGGLVDVAVQGSSSQPAFPLTGVYQRQHHGVVVVGEQATSDIYTVDLVLARFSDPR